MHCHPNLGRLGDSGLSETWHLRCLEESIERAPRVRLDVCVDESVVLETRGP